MPTLTSTIVKHQLASLHDVEDALARQALYGGDLATNLLETSSVSEAALTQLMAESHGLAAAPAGQLPRADAEVRRLIPRDIARRFNLYPLALAGDVLELAVSEPLPAEVESDLAFSLGLRIEQRVAMAVRVQEALSRDYELTLDRRTQRVLARLSGAPDPSPSVFPAPPDSASAEPSEPAPPPNPSAEAASAPPADAEPRHTPTSPAGSDPKPRVRREPLDLTSWKRSERRPSRARRLGPYTPAMAERDLMNAEARDDILRAFFDFAAQYFEYTALFAIHGDLAEGRDATGSGAPRARVVSLGIPLDLPSALSRATASDRFDLVRLASGGIDGALARDLDRRPGPLVLLLPIRVRGRCVLVLYGDHGTEDVELSALGPLIAFAPLVVRAFESLILRRKQRGLPERSVPPPEVRTRADRPALPRPEERARALASALGAEEASPAPPLAVARPVIAVGTRPVARESLLPDKPDASVPPPRVVTPVPSSLAPGAPPESSRFLEERGTKPGGIGTGRKLELIGDSLPPAVPSSDAPAPQTEHDDEAAPSSDAVPSSDAPEISVRELLFDDAAREEFASDSGRPPESRGVPLAPASRSISYSARPLPMPNNTEELRLPSVIVDLANDCQALLEQLLGGNPEAGDQLVQIGEPAVPVLVAAFPGPITAELRRGVGNVPGRASECGPVLRTLARIGVRAVPVLVVRTADSDATVRAWATRLLGEMPSEESARAIVRRFADEAAEVRRAALAAGRLLQGDADARATVQLGLAELVSDTSRPEELRHALIESMADLRDGRAVPTLVRLLEDPSTDIVRSAHWALVVLARQDFGTSGAAWEEWWRQSSGRHRIEWLIDALLHDSAEIRRAAGDELKSTTREYFGYYDDLPPAERQKAQTRYREWWETKGKARFR